MQTSRYNDQFTIFIADDTHDPSSDDRKVNLVILFVPLNRISFANNCIDYCLHLYSFVRGKGAIVVLASAASDTPSAELAVYGATKVTKVMFRVVSVVCCPDLPVLIRRKS